MRRARSWLGIAVLGAVVGCDGGSGGPGIAPAPPADATAENDAAPPGQPKGKRPKFSVGRGGLSAPPKAQ